MHTVRATFGPVILIQTRPQTRRLGSDDWIGLRIEVGVPTKQLNRNYRLLDLSRPSVQYSVNYETEESRAAIRSGKRCAAENSIELLTNAVRLHLQQASL
jgi:hypothetical protein